jgi:hypothetical protein
VIHERRCAKSNAEDCDDEKQSNYGFFDLYYPLTPKNVMRPIRSKKPTVRAASRPMLPHSCDIVVLSLARRAFLSLCFFQKLRQLHHVGRDPPRLVKFEFGRSRIPFWQQQSDYFAVRIVRLSRAAF